MKKLFYIILPLLVFVSCNKKQSKASQIIMYYPSKDFFRSNNLVEVNLNDSKLNFMKITDLVNDIHIKNSVPFISIKQNDTIKQIMPLRDDWGFRNENNILSVGKDSIYKDYSYPIKDIYKILKKHYENNGEDPLYAQSAERALVEIEIDTNDTGLELKKVIQKVIKTFDKINKDHKDSLQLKIGLSYFHQTPLPPFPEPSNEKQ